VLEGGASGDPAAKRLPIGNLINRGIGVVAGLALLPVLGPWLVTIDPDNTRVVADFHTGFNLILALIFFPLLKPYAGLLRRWLPARISAADPGHPMYLDPLAREMPVIALGAAAREALRLADVLETMLQGARDMFEKPDRRQISETKRLDDVLDKLNTAIKAYLTSLDPEAMSDADHRRVTEILAFATNLEQAGDIVDRNLLAVATKKLKRGIAFSTEGRAELFAMLDRLTMNLRAAASLFVTEDERAARLLVSEKEVFRSMEARATASHFERLRSGCIETAETSSLHLDALRDLKLINAHLVAAAAYPVLEGSGELLSSRLRQDD
jgi:phosphate:Na+ symporter